jgi:hypothetical protein
MARNSLTYIPGSRDHRTQFWKGAIQGPFHQCLVAIGPVVSEEMIKIRNVDGRKAMAIAHMAWRVKKGCTRLASASDKVYQLLAHGWWFSLGTPASSTTKTDRHDTTEILLSGVKHQVHSQNPLFSTKTFYLYLINDITEISLKVALNTINLTLYQYLIMMVY